MQIGACWIKQTQDGQSYLSCQIQVPLLTINFALFKAKEKKSANSPDYNIIWSVPRKKTEAVSSYSPFESYNPFDDSAVPTGGR